MVILTNRAAQALLNNPAIFSSDSEQTTEKNCIAGNICVAIGDTLAKGSAMICSGKGSGSMLQICSIMNSSCVWQMSSLLLSSSIRGMEYNGEKGGERSFSRLKLHYFFRNKKGKCNKVKVVAARNNSATVLAGRRTVSGALQFKDIIFRGLISRNVPWELLI